MRVEGVASAPGLTRVLIKARLFREWREGAGKGEMPGKLQATPPPAPRPCLPLVALGLAPECPARRCSGMSRD